jgi:hypothetical protein
MKSTLIFLAGLVVGAVGIVIAGFVLDPNIKARKRQQASATVTPIKAVES